MFIENSFKFFNYDSQTGTSFNLGYLVRISRLRVKYALGKNCNAEIYCFC